MGTKKARAKSLSSGRPPMAIAKKSMSRRASRALINSHHQLEKQRRQATSSGDKQTEADVAARIDALGGLAHYQRASLQGQSTDRGGDTSRVLLQWLSPSVKEKPRLRILEVGALSVSNACSTSGVFDEVVRIDLNSQGPGIQQQDFMERPLPTSQDGVFDLISLSLVLNFVPEAEGRGEMLLRTLSFLRVPTANDDGPWPSLFIVLPRSCLDNSRYFTDARLTELMAAMGYDRTNAKTTQKLSYSLWRRSIRPPATVMDFAKKELNPGRSRNNFVVTLRRKKPGAVG